MRNDWTRAEIAELFDLPFTELVFRAVEVHRAHHAPGDAALFAKLGLKPLTAAEPMRAAAA